MPRINLGLRAFTQLGQDKFASTGDPMSFPQLGSSVGSYVGVSL